MLFGTETFELGILNAIQGMLKTPFMDFLMSKISAIGDAGLIWIFIGIVLLCFKKYRKNGIVLLGSLILGFIIGNLILKNLIARPRPCWIQNDILLLIKNPTDFSFPSGHTLSSFVAAFTLWRTNKVFGYWAVILAGLIAFSRMYLFLHFPTDILFGIALAGFVSFIFKKIEKKMGL